MRLIDADALYEQIAKKEELARQRVLDTPSRMPNGDLNPSAMRYATQLDERTQMKFMIADAPTIDTEPHWIPCSERMPETDNKNSINNYNVLLWVKDKSHPEREPQIYLGKLRHIDGDDGSGNFWGVKTHPCDWTIWGWSYFNEPEVIAWMPLPKGYKGE